MKTIFKSLPICGLLLSHVSHAMDSSVSAMFSLMAAVEREEQQKAAVFREYIIIGILFVIAIFVILRYFSGKSSETKYREKKSKNNSPEFEDSGNSSIAESRNFPNEIYVKNPGSIEANHLKFDNSYVGGVKKEKIIAFKLSKIHKIFILIVWLVISAAIWWHLSKNELHNESKASIRGTLLFHKFEDSIYPERGRMFYLETEKFFEFVCQPGNNSCDPVKKINQIQLSFSDEKNYAFVQANLGNSVVVSGEVFNGHTAHHHLPVIISVDSISK